MKKDLLATSILYAAPAALAMLCVGALILVSFSGLAMLRGQLEAASFVAIATGFFGLLGGALGISNSQRPQQRSTDPQGPPIVTTEVTSGEATARTTTGPAGSAGTGAGA